MNHPRPGAAEQALNPPAMADPAPRPPVSRWALHRRMYDWVLSFAHSRHANLALFSLSFAESSFFPIPPDVLQIALTLERRNRAWFYAALSTIASVLGGLFGYAIGYGLWEALSPYFFKYIPGFTPEIFQKVQLWYEQYNFWIVFLAAFTPIPYKVFTIAGGVCHVMLLPFAIASLIGRAARFFIVAALLYAFGPPIKSFIERYFNLLSLVFGVLLVGGVLAVKLFR